MAKQTRNKQNHYLCAVCGEPTSAYYQICEDKVWLCDRHIAERRKNRKSVKQMRIEEGFECVCGYVFTRPGEFRREHICVDANGQSTCFCPDCGKVRPIRPDDA